MVCVWTISFVSVAHIVAILMNASASEVTMLGLSQDFKDACQQQQLQIFCPSRFSY